MSGLLFQELESQFTTPIPDQFITDCMPGANGNYVKVYLCAYYGYFHRIRGLTMSKIARKLHMLESEVVEALKYWHETGAVTFLYNAETDQYSLRFASAPGKDPAGAEKKAKPASSSENPVPSDPVPAKAETPKTPPKSSAENKPETALLPKQPSIQKVIRVEHAPTYSPDEILVYSKQPLCQELFQFAASLLGAPLSSVNASTVLSFYDFYRLPMDVIKFMMEYAVKNNHRSLRYMEKMALDWSENDIKTIEEATEYINRYAIYWPIMRAYNQNGTSPDEALKNYVDHWKNDWHLSEDLMVEAARRTYEQLHKASYPYTNSILENWVSHDITSLQEVSRLDEEHAASRQIASASSGRTMNNFSSKGEDYDYDQLANESMERFYAAYGESKESE